MPKTKRSIGLGDIAQFEDENRSSSNNDSTTESQSTSDRISSCFTPETTEDLCQPVARDLAAKLALSQEVSLRDDHKCTDCQQSFLAALFLRQHILVVHLQAQPERYLCSLCTEPVTDLYGHYWLHETGRFECQRCGRKCRNLQSFKAHLTSRGTRGCNAKTKAKKKTDKSPIECDTCGAMFDKKAALNKHLKTHINSRRKKSEDSREATSGILSVTPETTRGEPDTNQSDQSVESESEEIETYRCKSVNVACGQDSADCCFRHDPEYKLHRAVYNSKSCDTSDLEQFASLNTEPQKKRRKIF